MPVPSWSPSPLIPPFRFGTVEPDVYRGAYPKQRNLRFLNRLKLRTVLSLIPDAPDGAFQAFCTQHGIQSVHLPVDKVKDNVPLTYNRAVEALQIIINKENLPIYVHCLDGASVTGLVICCLRKLQTWNVSSALGEFLRCVYA
ncbi:protein-tyrosine phosphatase [Mortierella sp. GBAus27b]|nr:protein-tyrosine phosphatase [Mortierella sp. GBAus27b]